MVWGTHPAPNSPGNHKRFIAAGCGAVRVDDIWFFLGVGFAHGAATKFTGCVCGSFAVPAFHNGLPILLCKV